MTDRYVGPGGNDGNSGLTWALRKLTLNGVEDTPVVAGDDVYVGPGVYRELLAIDVAGNAGNIITYIGDVTGENTDGVGGIVRITGSANDQTAARTSCIVGASGDDYRTFRGFVLDTTSDPLILGTDVDNWIIEDCYLYNGVDGASGVDIRDTSTNVTIRRCVIYSNSQSIRFEHGVMVDNTGHLVENCLIFAGGFSYGVWVRRTGGVTIRNCTIYGYINVATITGLSVGQTLTVENCILVHARWGLTAAVLGNIIEDFNTFYGNSIDRTNVAVGGNSVSYTPLFLPPILYSGVAQLSGFKFPWWYSELSEWSQIQAITGANEPTEDLRGVLRPVTAAKNSWGALQFRDMERETGTVRTGSVSMVLHDAARHQIWVPVTASSTTIKVYVYREANYAGLLPQMIIKQPGVADRVTTDVGAAGGWNLLTDTFVPAALPPYVVVELVSRNTNGAADEVFFDDLDVS